MASATPSGLLQEMERAIASGDLRRALKMSKSFLSKFRSHPKAMRVRERAVQICIKLGDYAEGVRIGEAAGAAADQDAELLYAVAQAYVYGGQGVQAEEAVRRVLRADPDHPAAIARMAVLLQSQRRTDEAVALLDEAVARGVDAWDLDHAFAQLGPRVGRTAEAIDRVRSRLGLGDAIPKSGRAELLCGLAELLEKDGDYGGAWNAACEAAALMKTAWNAEWHERVIRDTIEAYSPEALRRMGEMVSKLEPCDDLLFVMGMPRSGTTLVEQILAAHPEIESVGETTVLNDTAEALGLAAQVDLGVLERAGPAKLAKSARQMRERLSGLSPKDDGTVLDKQPFNDRYIGLLAAMAPGARVVQTRRDPRDIAISCLFRNFVGGMEWSNSMAWISRLMEARLELHRHWLAVISEHAPWIRFTEARYESLVADPEKEARALVGAVGFEWDDACLNFDRRKRMIPTLQPGQTGRGVYSGSVGRWKRFEPYAGNAFEALHRLAEQMGYTDS
ncbi:MAG: hypothetical protein D6692_06735 [Planctomycetota bacterium]|nr:MAG: hypothetical protein D6692_06735 [Planctomycetota bacterium]